MRLSLDAVLPQVRAVGGELIVADASGLLPPDWASEADIHWLSLPGVPGYELRQRAYAAAQAPIVAVIEDHVAPSHDWLAAVLAEHEAYPDAAAIYGIVENGSRTHLLDWALFSVGYLAWAPPQPAGNGSPGHANLSFKNWAFSRVPPRDDEVLEFRYVDALRRAGYVVHASDRLHVTHYQSSGLRQTASLFFHNGRTIAGLRRRRMTGRDWIRTIAPLPIAAFRTLRTLEIARSKPEIEPAVRRSAPFIALLHAVHALGEGVGYLGGPGRSGSRLH